MSTALDQEILLLCSSLGEYTSRPFNITQYQHLRRVAEYHGLATTEPLLRLSYSSVEHLGFKKETAERIYALLHRLERLAWYMGQAEAHDIFAMTYADENFPVQFSSKLGHHCPPVLFCKGNVQLSQKLGVSLVGSRNLTSAGMTFARQVGCLAAQEELTLVSGGARGADRTAQSACISQGGAVLVFLADTLCNYHDDASSQILLMSEHGYGERFSSARAHSRNRLIHAFGSITMVAQSEYGKGGTWSGTTENLRHSWSNVYVHDDQTPGTKGLIALGATGIQLDALQGLRCLQPRELQMSFYEATASP